MHLRVVTPPSPIVTPADIPGAHAPDDASVVQMIAAATEEIDGPQGWLGRCLGPQELELTGWIGCYRFWLPCPPTITILSVSTEDCDGNAESADPASWRQDGDNLVIAEGASWVRQPVHRVRYKAGYNGTSGAAIDEVQTGDIPARVKQAIILAVQHMKALSADNLYLKVDEVEGVGRREFTLSDTAGRIIRQACDNLLSGLRIYR